MATKRKAPAKGASSSSRKKPRRAPKKPAGKSPRKKKRKPKSLIRRLQKRAGSTRKRAKAGKRKKGILSLSPRTLQTLYGLAAGLILSGLVLWLLWPAAKPKSHKRSSKLQIIVEEPRPAPEARKPVFEERGAAFNRHLALTDSVILQTLKASGMSGSAIRFNRVRNVVEGSLQFERAELGLDLGDRSPTRIEEKLLASLGRLDFPVTLTSQGTNGEEARLEVWLDGHLTHSIRLHLVSPPPEERAAGRRAKAAIIIDDLGNHPKLDAMFVESELRLNLAVLPASPAGRKVARLARERGRELMLHLPMEPHGFPGVNPGAGALLTSMDRAALLRTLDRDLEFLPRAVGVNNHMGSKLTEDEGRLEVILKRLKERGLFFIDSRTTAKSKVAEAAARVGLKTASRSVFLDNVPEIEAVQAQVQRFMAKATNKDRVIAIGHPYPATREVLARMSSVLKTRLELVPVSELVR